MTKILKLVYIMIFFVFLFFLVRVVNSDYPYPCFVDKKTCQLNCPKPLIGVCSNKQCHCIGKFKMEKDNVTT
ncbi:putative Late nodulin [Medicago truncatula]|uniref:Putative Late nodulin n=1 Tax=Medicago truncatula TaxID=3880 RepID=A0A396IT76_MEDTR|nr:putative Late nodulin [Medicago truncatula]